MDEQKISSKHGNQIPHGIVKSFFSSPLFSTVENIVMDKAGQMKQLDRRCNIEEAVRIIIVGAAEEE